MPLAHAKFFAEPREFTEEQIEELRTANLLREDAPAAPSGAPAVPGVTAGPAIPSPPPGSPAAARPPAVSPPANKTEESK